MPIKIGWVGLLLIKVGVVFWRLKFGAFFKALSLLGRQVLKESLLNQTLKSAVELLFSEFSEEHPLFILLNNCRSLIKGCWVCLVQHVYRERNRVADRLAALGQDLGLEAVFFKDPPSSIVNIFIEDC
ncbi:hypothetical protein ACOSP7_032114 [Xanthoceras sorbifolium]